MKRVVVTGGSGRVGKYVVAQLMKNNQVVVADLKPSEHEVEFIEAGAAQMPLENESADIISISYGIRNVVQRQEAFDEFARVLKKDGLVVINEFTKNKKENLLDHLTDFYLNKVLPVLGGLISKNKEAYRYLPDSIDEFLTTENLCKELKQSGLEPVYVKAFSMNISTLIIAKKI